MSQRPGPSNGRIFRSRPKRWIAWAAMILTHRKTRNILNQRCMHLSRQNPAMRVTSLRRNRVAYMRLRETCIFILLICLMLCFSSALAQAEGKFKLKPGARGKLCLSCHSTFSDKMKERHIHTPLAKGDCSGCHNPHASNHAMMMDGDADSICYKCHDSAVPEAAASVHQMVADGE